METAIFYFSGTGNSLKVARDLAAEIPQANIMSIPKVINQQLNSRYESIGIVFPVYMFGLPPIVSRFLKQLPADKNSYIFAVVTMGGTAGDALGQLKGGLKAAGLRLCAGFLVTMPGNYIPLYGAIAVDKQEKMFARELEKIKEIARCVKAQKMHMDRGPWMLNWLLSFIYKVCAPKIPGLDKGFWANDACNSCGICQEVCPVNNITLIEGKPKWHHKCEQCFACLQWCPQEAIQYGKNTAGRRRYRNPDILVQDIISGK